MKTAKCTTCLLAGSALVVAALLPMAASAHTHVFLGINLGGLFAPPPVVVYGPPVYYAPPPVYYARPSYYAPPGYYAPRAVYTGPYPVYHRRWDRDRDHHWRRGWRRDDDHGRHHRWGHHDDDDDNG